MRAFDALGGFANQPEAQLIEAIYNESGAVRAPQSDSNGVMNGAAHGNMKRTHSHTRPTVPAAYSSSAKYPASFSCISSPPVVFSPGIICHLYRFLFIEPPAAALYIMDWAGAFCAAPAL